MEKFTVSSYNLIMFRESVFDNMAFGFSSEEILQEPKVREHHLK